MDDAHLLITCQIAHLCVKKLRVCMCGVCVCYVVYICLKNSKPASDLQIPGRCWAAELFQTV